jgi:hypothetical protein
LLAATDYPGERVQRLVVLAAGRWPGVSAPDSIKSRINDNTVQPGCHRRVATEAGRTPEGGDHGVLEGVCRFLRITKGPESDGPQPVPVALEQLAKGVRIAIDVPLEQLSVRR